MEINPYPIESIISMGQVATQKPITRENADLEFQKMFYREILSQTLFSTDNQEEEKNSFMPPVNRQIFIDQMVDTLVQKNALDKKVVSW